MNLPGTLGTLKITNLDRIIGEVGSYASKGEEREGFSFSLLF